MDLAVYSAYAPTVRVRSGHVNEYNFTTASNVTVQFLTNPWDADNSPNPSNPDSPADWVVYDEIRAFNGLRSGHQMPNGLKVFPANNTAMKVVNNQQISEYQPDPLLDYIQPGKYDDAKKNRHEPWGTFLVNAILVNGSLGGKKDPAPGEHILLKFSRSTGDALKRALVSRYRDDNTFDATSVAWDLHVPKGTKALDVAKNTDSFIPTDGLNPVNLKRMLVDKRRRAEEAIESFLADSGSAVVDPEDFGVATTDFGSADAIEFDEALKAVRDADLVADVIEANSDDPFPGVSDNRLKRLLVENDVMVPRGASRDVLIARAAKHGWTSKADLPEVK